MHRVAFSSRRHHASSRSPGTQRAGFSIWDLLAVVVILVLLFALITPAVRTACPAARRLQCLNNMKNIALATHNFASGREGAIPLLEDGTYGWPIVLLPSLDSNALYREYTSAPDSAASEIWVSVFTCPKDTNNHRQPRGLSYVANAGYGNFRVNRQSGAISEVGTHTANIDWNNDGTVDDSERAVSRASGVFWRKHDDGFQMNLEYIEEADGTSQTILYSENLNARDCTSRETMDIAFVVGRDALGLAQSQRDYGPLRIQSETMRAFGINSNDGSLSGQSPVPSSNHAETVNVAFCDGRARAISETIDPRVYARLVTPNGETFGQLQVGDGDY